MKPKLILGKMYFSQNIYADRKYIYRRSFRPMRNDIARLSEIWDLREEHGYSNIRLYGGPRGREYSR